MKIIINEKQYKKLIDSDLDEEDTAAAEPSISTAGTSPTPSSSSSSSDSSTGYPQVGHWESGVTRGPANQIDDKSKWADIVGSTLKRGKANQLK